MNQKNQPRSKRQAMRDRRQQRKRQQRLTLLLGVGAIVLLLVALLVIPNLLASTPPVTPVTPIARPNADGRAMGDANAPVTLEVYEDFQCSACMLFSQQTEPQIVEAYVATGKVRYIFRQYPFLDDNSTSKGSDQSANASMCAAEQNRFWDYHDVLFANFGTERSNSFLTAIAEQAGLDMDQFNACFKADKFKDEIQQDLDRGAQLGVTGTPAVYVDGTKVVGATPESVPSFEDIRAAIDAQLSK